MSQTAKPHTEKTVEVTVTYLPAEKPFHRAFPEDTTLAVVRTEAMQFFGVADFTDRDRHEFQLDADGNRVDYNQTLAQFLGEHRKGLHVDLVEQVTAGGV